MEAQVQNANRLVQVVNTGNTTSSNATDGGKGFAQMLIQTIQGDAAGSNEGNTNVSGLLASMTPAWMMAFLSENGVEGASSTETLLTQVIEVLQGNDTELSESMLANPELQEWIAFAEAALQAVAAQNPLAMNQLALTEETITTAQAGQSASSNQQSLAHMKEVIQQFLTALKQNPNQPILAELAKTFQEMMQPALASHQVKPDSGLKHPLHARNDIVSVGSADGEMVTTSSSAQKASQAGQLRPESQQPNLVMHVAVESGTKSKLEALAAKSFVTPISTVETEVSASSMPTEEVETSTPANGTGNLADSLKALQSQVEKPNRVHAQQFAKEMSEVILKHMKVTSVNGMTEAKISLFPDHLGQVDVKISIQQGQVVAQFMADTVVGKELLESQMAQLRSALQNQGLQVNKLEVTQSNNLQSGMFHDQRQQQSSQQFTQQQQKNRQSSYTTSIGEFAGELDTAAQLRTLATGSSFHASA